MSGQLTPEAIVGLLAEENRMRAVAAIVLGATTTDEVIERSGLSQRDAIAALERLAGGGLVVTADDGALRVATEKIKHAMRSTAQARAAAAPPEDFGDVSADHAGVLRTFVKEGRLVSIPTPKAKRIVVLDWLARMFEPGSVYPEKRVNEMLDAVHPDVAALRRYLVDEGMLERRDGFYWRAGGTFEVD